MTKSKADEAEPVGEEPPVQDQPLSEEVLEPFQDDPNTYPDPENITRSP